MSTTAGRQREDRMAALERANEIRLARVEIKRRIAAGQLPAASVILECPPEASNWSVGKVIASQRWWGVKRCRKFLARNYIPETKPVGDLTDRQRRMLANQLAGEGQ